MKKSTRAVKESKPSIAGKMAGFFYSNGKMSTLIIVFLLFFGAFVYSSAIRREGFPSVALTQSILVGRTAGEPQQINDQFVKPISDQLSQSDAVDSFSATAGENYFQMSVFYNSGYDRVEFERESASKIDQLNLPCGNPNCYEFLDINAAKFKGEFDLIASVYDSSITSSETIDEARMSELKASAEKVASNLNQLDEVTGAQVIDQTNDYGGAVGEVRTNYSIEGVRSGDEVLFYDSYVVGVTGLGGDDLDIFELRSAVDELLASTDLPQDHKASVAIDLTDSVSTQIEGLRNSVLQAIAVVFILVAVIISIGAAEATGLFIVLVMLTTVTVLWAIGSSLNVITLFSLVLSLGLFVDDSIVVSESIQSQSSKGGKRNLVESIRQAVDRVAMPSLMGTITTMLVFAVLLAVGGIIGDFIIDIPITMIIALSVSYLLSITILPYISKFTIVRSSPFDKFPPISACHRFFAASWVKSAFDRVLASKKSIFAYVAIAVFISVGSIVAAGGMMQKLAFNIFPTADDADEFSITINLPAQSSLQDSKRLASEVDEVISTEIGEYVSKVNYGGQIDATADSVNLYVTMVPYGDRDPKLPELVDKIEPQIDELAVRSQGKVLITQGGGGPPPEAYPFKMQVTTSSEDEAKHEDFLAQVSEDFNGYQFELPGGQVSKVNGAEIAGSSDVLTVDGERYLELRLAVETESLSSALEQLKTDIKDKYPDEVLAGYNIDESDLAFDFGQESDNSDSFQTMGPAAGVALLTMFVLLTIQFKSLVKSLLVLTAVPFSLFGVAAGLYLMGLSLSFFTMLGIIGLIGISVNNTIMLTDMANKEIKDTGSTRKGVSVAAARRFRPLVATSLTTFAALIPLILFDPFWKPLAVALAGGLLSSTILVIICYPAFFIAADVVYRKVESPIARGVKSLFS